MAEANVGIGGVDEYATIPLNAFHGVLRVAIGLATHFIPPPIGSAAVIRFADLEACKTSHIGAYLTRYMTPTAPAIRLAADLITVMAAWYRSPAAIVLGVAIIVAAWTYGLLLLRFR
jgi:hypothetical protein